MPPTAPASQALREWVAARRRKLDKLEARCAWATDLAPPDPELAGEHLRAAVTLLSAHRQGSCRDLYTEAALAAVARIKQSGLRPIVQARFLAGLRISSGNPTLDALSEDFRRFGITDLRAAVGTAPPADAHKGRLGALNACRNKCAPGEPDVPELTLENIRAWRTSCDWLASKLNDTESNQLRAAFRSAPW